MTLNTEALEPPLTFKEVCAASIEELQRLKVPGTESSDESIGGERFG